MTQVVGENDWTEIMDFMDFNRIARARAEEIGISREWIDHLAGVTDRYAAKLLAPEPKKHFGRHSLLGVFNRALGLRIIVVKDDEAVAEIRKLAPPRAEYQVRHRAEAP
jgi:hypothetical protein